MASTTRATFEDLYQIDGKAEIVNGEIVLMSPTGSDPNRTAGRIYASLLRYEIDTHNGIALTDNAAFRVKLPGRESFSPDAAFFIGPDPGMKFYDSAPVFAVEVRSEGDYGPKAEKDIAQKIADYFAAGTLVVWDVDLLSEDVVRVHRASDPAHPSIFQRGQTADAEPAVPGWSMPVDDLFAS